MHNSQQYQPYQQNNFQPSPKPKSNKMLWIILGLVIGIPTVLMGGCGALILIGLKAEEKPNLAVSNLTSSTGKSIKPYFNAVILVGKSPKEFEKILGKPTESWVPTNRSSPSYFMQSYALGKEMIVEFHKNRIDSLVIFFNERNVDSEMAYRLVGLDYAKPKPAGISDITTGEDWIKIYY